jgi:arylsulfatase A-like enzyme
MDDHQTCSNWTFPGTSCTILGRYHEDNGHIPQISAVGRAPFPDGLPFLARVLQDAGYYTAISSRNGWLSSEWNNTQGYERELPGVIGASDQMARGLDELAGPQGPVARGQPWFLHVHVTEPHVSYNPPTSYLGELAGLDPIDYDLTVSDQHYDARDAWPSLSKDEAALVLQHMKIRYRAEIAWLDDLLEESMARFDAEGLLDDTLVVVWNDHGEQFWEHGHLTHAYDLYREENDGYLFFWSKGIVPTAWTGPTTAVDVVPTVLDAVGVADTDWRSGEVIGTADPRRHRFALSVARIGVVASVTRGNDRMIFYGRPGRVERYDLGVDPGETTDLYGQDASLDGRLWDLLKPQVEKAQAAAPNLIVNWPAE